MGWATDHHGGDGMTVALRPPIPYFGAKQTVAERIVELLPPHLHYVEPYCGSLSVLLAKPPVRMETVNDLDNALMTFWTVLRDRPADLERACALTPHSRIEYEACRLSLKHGARCGDLEQARLVWVCLTQGRGGTLRSKGSGWRHFVAPRGSNRGMPGYLDSYVDRIAPAAERLHAVSLECMPALDLIAKYGDDPETLLYVDPPYVGSCRTHGDQYRHEMRDDQQHQALAEALHRCRASVVLSGYPSELYDRDLYADWQRVNLPTRTGNGAGDRGMDRIEVLWSNRMLGTQLGLFDVSATTPETEGA
jgi:DNA adenine methylase